MYTDKRTRQLGARNSNFAAMDSAARLNYEFELTELENALFDIQSDSFEAQYGMDIDALEHLERYPLNIGSEFEHLSLKKRRKGNLAVDEVYTWAEIGIGDSKKRYEVLGYENGLLFLAEVIAQDLVRVDASAALMKKLTDWLIDFVRLTRPFFAYPVAVFTMPEVIERLESGIDPEELTKEFEPSLSKLGDEDTRELIHHYTNWDPSYFNRAPVFSHV